MSIERRFKRIMVPPKLVTSCFAKMETTDPSTVFCKLEFEDLPPDHMVVSGHYDPMNQCFWCLVYHETFPIADPGELVPEIKATASAIRVAPVFIQPGLLVHTFDKPVTINAGDTLSVKLTMRYDSLGNMTTFTASEPKVIPGGEQGCKLEVEKIKSDLESGSAPEQTYPFGFKRSFE